MGKKLDVSFHEYGKLFVLCDTFNVTKYNHSLWLCLCKCGKFKTTTINQLRSGKTTSCGCLFTEHMVKLNKSRRGKSRYGTLGLRRVAGGYKINAKKQGESLDPKYLQDWHEKYYSYPCVYGLCAPINEHCDRNGDVVLTYQGIDSVDFIAGHIHSNMVPCCQICNFGKSDKPLIDKLNRIERIYNNRIKT